MNAYQLRELNKVISQSVKISHIVEMRKGFRVFHETKEFFVATYIKEDSVSVHVGAANPSYDINSDADKDQAQADYDVVMTADELYEWEVEGGYR